MTPILLADNRFSDGAITATGVTGDSRLYITDGRPYTFLTFPDAGTKTIDVDCGSAKSADALGIIGHNLSSASATVSVSSSSNGSSWTERLAAVSPASDRALLVPFTTASARYWRVTVVSASVAVRLAVVMVGSRITFPYPPDSPFIPYTESVEAESNDSKSGNPLGTVVRYFPIDIKANFSNLTRSWVESNYLPFRTGYGRLRKYFFWAADLTTWPTQVFYVQDSGKYGPDISNLGTYNKLALELKGVAEP